MVSQAERLKPTNRVVCATIQIAGKIASGWRRFLLSILAACKEFAVILIFVDHFRDNRVSKAFVVGSWPSIKFEGNKFSFNRPIEQSSGAIERGFETHGPFIIGGSNFHQCYNCGETEASA